MFFAPRTLMNKVFLIAACIFFNQVLSAQPVVADPPLKKLKILSWNIYMLPQFIASGSGKKNRADGIARQLELSDYDIVVFQEAFHPMARKIIIERLKEKFPFHAGPANRRLISLKTNSGLLILSKYPILSLKSIRFQARAGVDALSRKGALLIEVEMEGQRIQIAGTHLQNAGDANLRHRQCTELYQRLLQPNARAGVPQIICGDFNIDKSRAGESYRFVLYSLDALDQLTAETGASYDRINNDLHVEGGDRQELIDYILTRENGGQILRLNSAIRIIQEQWCKAHQDLSDHYSLEAEFLFSNAPSAALASLRSN